MAAGILIHETVLQLLSESKGRASKTHGLLIGQEHHQRVKILCCTRCTVSVLDDVNPVLNLLPGGLSVVGVCHVSDQKLSSESSIRQTCGQVIDKLLDLLGVSHILLLDIVNNIASSQNMYVMSDNNRMEKVTWRTLQGDELEDSVLLRLKAELTLSFQYNNKEEKFLENLGMEVDDVRKQVSSGFTVFHLQDSNMLVMQNVSPQGIPPSAVCRELFNYVQSDKTENEISRKKKKSGNLRTIQVQMYKQMTSDAFSQLIPMCTPVIHQTVGNCELVQLPVNIDVLVLVDSLCPVSQLYQCLSTAVCRQLLATEKCIAKGRQGKTFLTSAPFHIRPLSLPFFVTVVYQQEAKEEKLESKRKELHQLFNFPLDFPIFRRANAVIFPEEHHLGGYLINPHIGLPPSGVNDGGTPHLTKGSYTYHHYMQDRFDDSRWGCAYRSLQTLVSWFRFQGYTSCPIPTHRVIQKCLVDVGDKDQSFVGSRKWIGSLEVSYCLDHLIGVTSKIMSVSCGSDLATKGRELAVHFQVVGTPIMIGGGVLAHTILGVDYNEKSGELKFLILDPHYTGEDNLRHVQEKGWCGWKGPKFWDQNAHYNLCLPQRPKVI